VGVAIDSPPGQIGCVTTSFGRAGSSRLVVMPAAGQTLIPFYILAGVVGCRLASPVL